ncbi:hypothetical protein ACQY0O_006057 [Thecaphora frezii]
MTINPVDVEQAWIDLLVESGGSWPPVADHAFPWPLDVYSQLASEMPARVTRRNIGELKTPMKTILDNRQWLAERLPTWEAVEPAIDALSQRQKLGFASCVTFLSHLYRWGVLPVVAAAQDDTTPSLPPALAKPLALLNGQLGINSAGGSLTTLSLSNIDLSIGDEGALLYSTTRHLGGAHASAEFWNVKLFYEMERRTLPLYVAIVAASSAEAESRSEGEGEGGSESEGVAALECGVAAVRDAFKYFHAHLKEPYVERGVWMSYAQGFHGWGWGTEGVSGDQSIMIRVLDALLGVPPSSPPTHLTAAQRGFVDAVRAAQLRRSTQLAPILSDLVRILKTWRMGHLRRAVYYENLDLPERKPMTAGTGTESGSEATLATMIQRLEAKMKDRIALTR